MSKCNFTKRIDLCNKLKYQLNDIWDEIDESDHIFKVGRKMQMAFKMMLFPTAFLGLITNAIVLIVILMKENTDLFKQYKEYSYLYLNSIFCIIIMVIELLSWLTECYYPIELFCPKIRNHFKVLIKECLITLSRFMFSFTYIAFSLNQISLIGTSHGKFVTFFSQLGIKVFIGVTILISCSLSWIKGFKYHVNHFVPFLNYPISSQIDILIINSDSFKNAYFIINFICDLFNYFVFVVICVIIDVCMVVKLREAEYKKAVKKVINMVILNITIGVFFKLPSFFIPLLNLVAEYYYKNEANLYTHPNFGEFYSMLHDTQIYHLIQDISYFLYTFSLSIPIFIYIRFDNNFKLGFERFKNLFKSSNKSKRLN